MGRFSFGVGWGYSDLGTQFSQHIKGLAVDTGCSRSLRAINLGLLIVALQVSMWLGLLLAWWLNFIFPFFFLATSQHMEFPGQESDPSLSFNCGSVGSFDPLCQAGVKDGVPKKDLQEEKCV